MDTFNFSGVDSRSFKIIYKSNSLSLSGTRRVSFISVPGKSGSVDASAQYPYYIYDNIIHTLTCQIMAPFAGGFGGIAQWLTGRGELIFSNKPDRTWDCVNVALSTFAPKNNAKTAEFEAAFECLPFSRGVPVSAQIQAGTVSFTSITQPYAYPTLTFPPSGAGYAFSLNGVSFNVAGTHNAVTVDCGACTVTEGGASILNSFSGDFPYIKSGENTIASNISATISYSPLYFYE